MSAAAACGGAERRVPYTGSGADPGGGCLGGRGLWKAGIAGNWL